MANAATPSITLPHTAASGTAHLPVRASCTIRLKISYPRGVVSFLFKHTEMRLSASSNPVDGYSSLCVRASGVEDDDDDEGVSNVYDDPCNEALREAALLDRGTRSSGNGVGRIVNAGVTVGS